MFSNMFVLRGSLNNTQKIILNILGILIFLLIWHLLPTFDIISNSILPAPLEVFNSIKTMYLEDNLFKHIESSLVLNLLGYAEAIMISTILGFIIGLSPICRGLSEQILASTRFLPLSAMTGIFIVWFGLQTTMKVQFLAFGISVYLLPVVIQRIDEVQQVYIDTVKTLGANTYQTITSVFIPDVISRLFDDIRVLTAISWTYIIIAELINKTYGLGALAYLGYRQSHMEKVYAVLIIIMIIGILQDQLFKYLDKIFFKYKHL